jgi:Sec-independent protein secretion pathway component TatC
LFLKEASLAYGMVSPSAWKFFLSFKALADPGILPIHMESWVNEYLTLVTKRFLSFGLYFQLPILPTKSISPFPVVLLSKHSTYSFYSAKKTYIFFLNFVALT